MEQPLSVPTSGEKYSELMHHIRMAQEASATLSHLANANDSHQMALAWLAISEQFKRMQHVMTMIAQGKYGRIN